MNVKQVFEIPVLTSELEDKVQVEIEGIAISLVLRYFDQKKIRLRIRFNSVVCHMYTSERFTRDLMNAYDKVVEIEDSEWLQELKELNEIDYSFYNPKHYAVYLEDLGMCQFIAKSCEIIIEE